MGVLSIKNGQSAPSSRDNFSNSILEILRLNNWFRAFRVNDPSDEPPPNPAPIGILLWRWIWTGEIEKLELIKLKAFIHIFSPAGILIPEEVNKNEGDSIISRISKESFKG